MPNPACGSLPGLLALWSVSPTLAQSFETLCGAPAAWRDLSARGRVRVTGTDRVRFLNGMLTCDIEVLSPFSWSPALQLDRKGHVLVALDAIALEREILLDVDPGGESALVEMLDRHMVADDVILESLSADWGALAIEGPGAVEAAVRRDGPPLDPGRAGPAAGLVWLAGGGLGGPGVRALGPRELLDDLRHDLDLPKLEADAAEILRIEAGLPRCGVDTGERTFPQEAGLESAVSFTKGCYIGQEIVARIHSRGAVNKRLVQLACEEPVGPGDEIQVGGRGSGHVTSSAVSPLRGPLCLGFVRAQDAAAGTRAQVGGSAAVVTDPAAFA